MTHEQAKSLLRESKTLAEREAAILNALNLGMPLSDIEQFLDWLDATRSTRTDGTEDEVPGPPSSSRAKSENEKRIAGSDEG